MEQEDVVTMHIAVGPAGKVGEGVNAYYVYTVTSEPIGADVKDVRTDEKITTPKKTPVAAAGTPAAAASEIVQVDRRYSDFLWLHDQVQLASMIDWCAMYANGWWTGSLTLSSLV